MDPSENAPPSRMPRLRAPTQLPTPAKGLAELSASDSNARGGIVPSTDRKHRVHGLPEPTAKRQTLVEKAGRPYSQTSAYSQSTVGSAKGPSAGSARHAFSKSVSGGRPTSNRSQSSNSMAQSVGPGMRPPSNTRPHTSMSHNRTKSYNMGAGVRPASSMAGSLEAAESRKQNGRVIPSVSTFDQHRIKISQPPCKLYTSPIMSRTSYRTVSRGSESSTSSRSCSDPYQSALPQRREFSLVNAFQSMSIDERMNEVAGRTLIAQQGRSHPTTPSQIPRPMPQPSPKIPASKFFPQTPAKKPDDDVLCVNSSFLTKDSNLKTPIAWDHERQMEKMDALYTQLQKQVEGSVQHHTSFQETLELYKTRITQLEIHSAEQSTQMQSLSREVDEWRSKASETSLALEQEQRNSRHEVEDLQREHRNHIEDMADIHKREIERAQSEVRHEADGYKREAQDHMDRLHRTHREEMEETERRLAKELEDAGSARAREVQELASKYASQCQDAEMEHQRRDRETKCLQSDLDRALADIQREKENVTSLKEKLAESAASNTTLEASMRDMKAKIDFLESDNQAQSQAFVDNHQKMQDAIQAAEIAKQKLMIEETLRRKLHNQVQELKGNIRVFCRVRPTSGDETEAGAKIAFPDAGADSKEVVVQGPETKSALGNDTTASHAFSFDRVFDPTAQNPDVFEEISQLVQSALDGYNVCIFCYGQTGAGKTYTMSSADGMIPKAVQQIYTTASTLEEKGWKYRMEGSFVEVYNENLNDLLGKSEELDKKKLEIRHDTAKGQTTITDVTTVVLDGPQRVEDILRRANVNRSVAATKSNERSSRSHSVFILKLIGENSVTGERSEGTLNLVDLAGSERIDKSGVEGARLRETQNINRSLSCLGDVIGALGQNKGGSHIPYRNSKLTYLLQFSLSGNSKTLMFVMVSPMQAHLNETLTSLRFATKVHNTHIGTAKRQARVKD